MTQPRREVLLIVHPDRDTTREASGEVAMRLAAAGIGLRVLDDEVRRLVEPHDTVLPCTVVSPAETRLTEWNWCWSSAGTALCCGPPSGEARRCPGAGSQSRAHGIPRRSGLPRSRRHGGAGGFPALSHRGPDDRGRHGGTRRCRGGADMGVERGECREVFPGTGPRRVDRGGRQAGVVVRM